MKLRKPFLILAFSILLLPADLFAQQFFQLNSIDSNSKQIASKTVTGEFQHRAYFELNNEPFENGVVRRGDRLSVDLSPSENSVLHIDRVEQYAGNSRSFIARDELNPENVFAFTYSSGKLYGVYHYSHEETYFFEFDRDAGSPYVALNSSFYDDEQFCSLHETHLKTPENVISNNQAKSHTSSSLTRSSPHLSAMASSIEEEVTIDIMVPYTENARVWAEGSDFESIEAVISQAMALSQAALDNSDIAVNLRLVHYYETDYSDDSLANLEEDDPDFVSAGDHLRRLTRSPGDGIEFCGGQAGCSESDFDGFMEEVHGLRDQYGADLVAAFLSEPNTGGIAWRANSILGNAAFGFSVNRVQQMAVTYTLIHEIGHNMGSAHARNQNQAAAGDFGGVFVYSTGNRFSIAEDDYATVMAYAQDGYSGIPSFSNPDVTFLGVSTGNSLSFGGEAGPSDNAKSINQIKRVIASYRPTLTDPPVADVDLSSISVELDQNDETAVVPVVISNNGSSDLVWDIDFDIESGVILNKKRTSGPGSVGPEPEIQTFNESSLFAEPDENGVVFSTTFDSNEGFSAGDFSAAGGWRSFNVDGPIEISDENPSAGNLHLRIPRRPDISGSMFARSILFGPQPMGEYSVSFDLATFNLNVAGDGETFVVYIYDAATATRSSGILVASESIFVLEPDESGEENFVSTGAEFPHDGSYRSIEVRYNPNNKTVDYHMDGTQIASVPYAAGRKPDYIHVGHGNSVSGSYMDIDNIEVKRLNSPFNWLTTSRTAGVVAPGSSQTVELTLSANDVETGEYQTVLLLRSNDPANPLVELPIAADIQMATGISGNEDSPQRLSLSQNYPNPFNPSTRIEFTLDRAGDVRLDVFNITGQRVATLVEESMSAGQHAKLFDASHLSSGVYMYRLQTSTESLTRQMILIK